MVLFGFSFEGGRGGVLSFISCFSDLLLWMKSRLLQDLCFSWSPKLRLYWFLCLWPLQDFRVNWKSKYGHMCRFNMDPAWSETGDRYMLKLFRDFVFHAVDENGIPWMDMSHMIQCLNKVSHTSTSDVPDEGIIPSYPQSSHGSELKLAMVMASMPGIQCCRLNAKDNHPTSV